MLNEHEDLQHSQLPTINLWLLSELETCTTLFTSYRNRSFHLCPVLCVNTECHSGKQEMQFAGFDQIAKSVTFILTLFLLTLFANTSFTLSLLSTLWPLDWTYHMSCTVMICDVDLHDHFGQVYADADDIMIHTRRIPLLMMMTGLTNILTTTDPKHIPCLIPKPNREIK